MKVLEFEEALAEVMGRAKLMRESRGERPTESLPLLRAAGRVLAAPIIADRDQPPFNRATRDGFAVRAEDIASGRTVRVAGLIRAGERWEGPAIGVGECVEIMTGAPMPAGANAVVMIEHVQVSEGTIRPASDRAVGRLENIVVRGAEAKAGDALVSAGTVITGGEIALAAACGMAHVSVFPRASVAIISTGDELVELERAPEAHQIRNSNSYGLAALIDSAGGSAHRMEIARDSREDLRDRIASGRTRDLMLLSGGVSMGKYDLVEEVLAEFGAEFFFSGVKMQPGKPVVFGRLPERDGVPECYFFGLPGNPVSTQVTFHCFVEPFLRRLCGQEAQGPRFVQATLGEDVPGKAGLMRLLPARLESALRTPMVRLVGWQGSGDLAANARANCYAVLPPERGEFRAGDVISVLLR